MKLKEVTERLGDAVEAIANLGVEKPILKSIFEPVSSEIHRLVMLEGFDRRDIVEDPKTRLIYVVNSEDNFTKLQKKFAARHARGGTGISSPLVTVTELEGFPKVINLPWAEAELSIATDPDLSDTLPSEFGIEPLEGKPRKFNDLGLEAREAVTRYALGQRPSLYIEKRSLNSKTIKGRFDNVTKDVSEVIGEYGKAAAKAAPVLAKEFGSEAMKAVKDVPVIAKGFQRGALDVERTVEKGIVLVTDNAKKEIEGTCLVGDIAQTLLLDRLADGLASALVNSLDGSGLKSK